MKLKQLFNKKEKWTKYTFVNIETGAMCLMGGLNICYPNYEKKERVINKIKTYLKANHYRGGILGFNDARRRKFKDIRNLVVELDI